jgi:hypothetical protein
MTDGPSMKKSATEPPGHRPSEAETFWTEFLRGLKGRGLDGVKLVISDAHTALKAAIASGADSAAKSTPPSATRFSALHRRPTQRCPQAFTPDLLHHVDVVDGPCSTASQCHSRGGI